SLTYCRLLWRFRQIAEGLPRNRSYSNPARLTGGVLVEQLALPWRSAYLPPGVATVDIVSFRSHDDRRPSKFIVLADNMRSAINMACEHGGADFQSRFDKSTAKAQEMKEGALRVL